MSWLYCPGVAKNANTRYLRSFPFLNPLHIHQIIVIGTPIKSILLPGTHILEQNLRLGICQVDRVCLPIPPTIQYTDGIWFNPERNEKRVNHIKYLHVFFEKLKLIQVSHILGLDVHVYVGELPIRVLGTKMLCCT
jgi:hypothetical protein